MTSNDPTTHHIGVLYLVAAASRPLSLLQVNPCPTLNLESAVMGAVELMRAINIIISPITDTKTIRICGGGWRQPCQCRWLLAEPLPPHLLACVPVHFCFVSLGRLIPRPTSTSALSLHQHYHRLRRRHRRHHSNKKGSSSTGGQGYHATVSRHITIHKCLFKLLFM